MVQLPPTYDKLAFNYLVIWFPGAVPAASGTQLFILHILADWFLYQPALPVETAQDQTSCSVALD